MCEISVAEKRDFQRQTNGTKRAGFRDASCRLGRKALFPADFGAQLGDTYRCALHYFCGAARGVRSSYPRGLTDLLGAVPDRARGLGHMAPTYLGREPGIERSYGRRGSALFYSTPAPD